jgi:cyclophilin family peptidyl-prolyl cis-trans isomerase/HEAT repeat protein
VLLGTAEAQSLRERILAAEDARVTSTKELTPILAGLHHANPAIVVQAVRALGRFERPAFVDHIQAALTHSLPEVRAEAANALGQSLAAIPRGADVQTPAPPELAVVTRALLARLRNDAAPYVSGIAAETLGRLPYRSPGVVHEVEQALAALLAEGGSPPPLFELRRVTGVVKGLESLIRLHGTLQPPAASTTARLRVVATRGSDAADGDVAFIRRVAWLALIGAGGVDIALVQRGFDDRDPQVRRLAVLALANVDAGAQRRELLARALGDSSFNVRYDAVRVYSRTLQSADCAPMLAAVDDRNTHVSLAAIDALGNGCPAGPSPVERLRLLADDLSNTEPATRGATNHRPPTTKYRPPTTNQTWHRPAHAFVSLARLAREEATTRLARFAEHPTWQMRMYAARAAATVGAAERLHALAGDAHDNVREAAIGGLVQVRRHEADDIYIDALGRSDYQLVLTAARALEGSPNRQQAAPALIAAFKRLTAEGRDTSRDPRIAILVRLRELGRREHAPALQSCLTDFDRAVAAECAATQQAWTGARKLPTPQLPTPKPAASRTRAASGAAAVDVMRARVTMKGGGTFDLRLLPEDAPATVARVVRLARQGYYNGLTFHRVVPNFVIQGGSPRANEYVGDGPFMRDELGLRTHARGTLGISTRGRDTGDAQIFVNLVDNPRLDHNFTVFADVTDGMDVVDGILEGDVIERIDILDS